MLLLVLLNRNVIKCISSLSASLRDLCNSDSCILTNALWWPLLDIYFGMGWIAFVQCLSPMAAHGDEFRYIRGDNLRSNSRLRHTVGQSPCKMVNHQVVSCELWTTVGVQNDAVDQWLWHWLCSTQIFVSQSLLFSNVENDIFCRGWSIRQRPSREVLVFLQEDGCPAGSHIWKASNYYCLWET